MKKSEKAALTLAGMVAVGMGVAYCTYRTAFYSKPGRSEDIYKLPKGEQYESGREIMCALISEMEKLPCEQVYIKSYDGLKLAARYYHNKDGAPLQIQFHGYKGCALRDFCGGNMLAREMGHNTLVVDQRAHGKSEGHTISFGIKERYDCLSWINYACSRFGRDIPIILSGVSMGASTVLMAAELDLPKNVVCIVADSPYSSPEAIIRKVCTNMKLNNKIAYPFVRLGARVFGDLKLSDGDAVRAVKKSKVPILIIHGEDDRFVPCEMSGEIYNSSPELIVRETFPGAGHAISFITDIDRYRKLTRDFIEKNLKP
ncbi:MAG: alpha/beta hydrolase [Lachnospiraceae bacterium]